MDQPVELIDSIVAAEAPITSGIATLLGRAFSTSSELWLNLEINYRSFARPRTT
jgi:plasmid maintenance system antidote protein VapI